MGCVCHQEALAPHLASMLEAGFSNSSAFQQRREHSACCSGTPEGRVEGEFRKLFQPDQCSLEMLDAAQFDAALAGRRLIMFGDSIMRIQWLSLACLLRSQVRAAAGQHVQQCFPLVVTLLAVPVSPPDLSADQAFGAS